MHPPRLASAVLALVGAVGTAQATTVNISARVDPSQTPGSVASQFFSAGTYNISVFDNSGSGGYNGWSYSVPVANQAKPYRETFSYSIGGVSTTYDVSTGGPTGYYTSYASTSDALAAFATAGSYAKLSNGTYLGSSSRMQLILASDATVLFTVPDSPGQFGDNGGGVSLSITPASVPEPASCALALAGLGALGWTRRRKPL